MKKKIVLLLMVISIFTLTACGKHGLYYEGYKHLNFKEVLEAESFEIENADYKETDDQAIIYLFRGQGCGYCRSFISFLNSISEEYGKYFKVVSFEVWNDQKNNELWHKLPDVTEVEARGVPYIIIGNRVFDGYTSSYDEEIKAQIMRQYEDNSYDVFEELYKYENRFKGFSNTAVILINLFVVAICTVIIIINNNKNRERIINALGTNVRKYDESIVRKEKRKKKVEE